MMKDYRDRTSEFFATVTALQKQRELTSKSAVAPTKTTPLLSDQEHIPRRTQFTKAAAEISRNIYVVSQNLEKLAHLAKSKSLFKDPIQEINALTYSVKHDITTLNTEIDALDKWVHEHVGPNKQSQENSDSIVQNLKSELATQTKAFADILSVRTRNMKDLNAHRKEFEAPTDSQLLRKRTVNYTARLMSDSPIAEEGQHEEKQLETGRQQEQQQQQLLQEEIQDEYLLSRAAAVEQIEKTIVELGEMYQRLISLVAMQEEMVIRIDENVEQSLENVRGGHKELIRYFGTISNGQWLLVKIFLILIVFGVLFITIM